MTSHHFLNRHSEPLGERKKPIKKTRNLRSYAAECAFTLAEVLITLGIVGIIAALTIPTLIAKYQERVLINQLKTAYSILNQAFAQAARDYGEVDTWGANIPEIVNNAPNILSKYTKVAKFCTVNDGTCNAIKYQSRPSNNGSIAFLHGQGSSVVLANGMIVVFRDNGFGASCNKTVQEYNSLAGENKTSATYLCMSILVDVNGAKKPNFASKDLFEFFVLKDGIVPAGDTTTDKNWSWMFSFTSNCKNLGPSHGVFNQANCTAWVLANDNMDYLHCPDKILWAGPHSCKEAE